jgi:hypothetical protein
MIFVVASPAERIPQQVEGWFPGLGLVSRLAGCMASRKGSCTRVRVRAARHVSLSCNLSVAQIHRAVPAEKREPML